MGKFVDSLYNPDKSKEISEERWNLHRRAAAIKEKCDKKEEIFERLVKEDSSLGIDGPLARCVKFLMDDSEGADEKNKAFLRAIKTPEGEAEVYFKIVKMGLEQNVFKSLSPEEMLDKEEANPGFSALVFETQNVSSFIRTKGNPYISNDILDYYSANNSLLQGRNEYNQIELMAFEEWVYADDIDPKTITQEELQDEVTSSIVGMQEHAKEPIANPIFAFVGDLSYKINNNAKIEDFLNKKGVQLDPDRNACEFTFTGVVDGVEKTFSAKEMYEYAGSLPSIPEDFTVNTNGAEKLDAFAEKINDDIPFVNRLLAVDVRKQLYTPSEDMKAAHDASIRYNDRVARSWEMWDKIRETNPSLTFEASSPFSRIMFAFMDPDAPIEKNVETALRLRDPEYRKLEIYKLIKAARENAASASLSGKAFTDTYCRDDMLFEKLMVMGDLLHEPGLDESVRAYCTNNIGTFTGIDPGQFTRVYATDEWLYSGDSKDPEKDLFEAASFKSNPETKKIATMAYNYTAQLKFLKDNDAIFEAFEINDITKENLKSLDRYNYSVVIDGQEVSYKYSEIDSLFSSGKVQVEQIVIREKPFDEQAEFDRVLDNAIAVSENIKKDFGVYSAESVALAIRSNEAMLKSRDYANLDYGFFSFGHTENKAAIKNFKESFKEFTEGLKGLYEQKAQMNDSTFKHMLLDSTNDFLVDLDSTIKTLKAEPGEERRLAVLNAIGDNLKKNLELDNLMTIVGREEDAMALDSIARDEKAQNKRNEREKTVDVIRNFMTDLVWDRFQDVKGNDPKYAEFTKENIASLMKNHSKFMDMTLDYIDEVTSIEEFAKSLSPNSIDYQQSADFLERFVDNFSSHLESQGLTDQAQQHLEKDALVQLVSFTERENVL